MTRTFVTIPISSLLYVWMSALAPLVAVRAAPTQTPTSVGPTRSPSLSSSAPTVTFNPTSSPTSTRAPSTLFPTAVTMGPRKDTIVNAFFPALYDELGPEGKSDLGWESQMAMSRGANALTSASINESDVTLTRIIPTGDLTTSVTSVVSIQESAVDDFRRIVVSSPEIIFIEAFGFDEGRFGIPKVILGNITSSNPENNSNKKLHASTRILIVSLICVFGFGVLVSCFIYICRTRSNKGLFIPLDEDSQSVEDVDANMIENPRSRVEMEEIKQYPYVPDSKHSV